MEVRIGFFSFTEVTDPGAHRAYNAWHQLDHLPQQYAIPGVAHGQRWVATPACRAGRAVPGPGFDRVHYLTLYLMGAPVAETLDAFRSLARRLREAGRFFEDRLAHLSGPFAVTERAAAGRVLVSADVVAVRPNLGVYAVVESGASASAPPDLDPLVGVAGVAGAWTFTATAELQAAGWHPGDRRVTVCYLDEPPAGVSPRLDALVGAARSPFSGTVEFAGAFETIVAWSWDWFDDPDGA
jgi:hypothetical protein